MSLIKNKTAFSIIVSIIIILFLYLPSAHASDRTPLNTFSTINKEYYVVLFGFVFFLPEIVELDFSDNGTFSLTSDLWDEPANGTYDKNTFLIKGAGTTGIFYDLDFEEMIEIQYSFSGLPIGLRDFYVIGTGTRKFTFLKESKTVSENFIFTGPGF